MTVIVILYMRRVVLERLSNLPQTIQPVGRSPENGAHAIWLQNASSQIHSMWWYKIRSYCKLIVYQRKANIYTQI